MTQAQARARYPLVIMADGDYTRMLVGKKAMRNALKEWASRNPGAYSIDSECVLGRSYDATKCKHLINKDGIRITITLSN